uniref:Dolichol-phosphate mannosyltransferase subunit 3 n=1 Tax=Physcomitrium patens TaxID=3218 RepID=A0A2K1JEJ2_PHYPA|nr:hypothetical protein PHYPA_020222 [Physcomitrium patens]
MKLVWKICSIFTAVVVVWILLLLAKDLASSVHLIVPYISMFVIMSLGCCRLGVLSYGMMVFRFCVEEEILLQKDIEEQKHFSRSVVLS